MSFLTVSNKVVDVINTKIFNYIPKGAKEIILEGEFFYFLNDFSKYPGFQKSFLRKLKQKLKREIKQVLNMGDPQISTQRKEIWDKLTKLPYYDWNSTPTNFIRKVVKKSSNSVLEKSFDY